MTPEAAAVERAREGHSISNYYDALAAFSAATGQPVRLYDRSGNVWLLPDGSILP